MLRDIIKNQHIRPPSAALIFDDGEILWGDGLGVIKSVVAELCFNTSQSGYQETLTDPSYAKQIITFTFPHIGIVGTNSEDQESAKIYADLIQFAYTQFRLCLYQHCIANEFDPRRRLRKFSPVNLNGPMT